MHSLKRFATPLLSFLEPSLQIPNSYFLMLKINSVILLLLLVFAVLPLS